MSLRDAPPNTETLHKLGLSVSDELRVDSTWLPSGNQLTRWVFPPSGIVTGWVSPLYSARRKVLFQPVKARYLPSGEMAALKTGSFSGLAVNRRSVKRTAAAERCPACQPAMMPASKRTTAARPTRQEAPACGRGAFSRAAPLTGTSKR